MTLRILHFASGDGWGGAERVIETLVRSTLGHAEIETLLLNQGALAQVLRALGVPVHVIPETDRSFASLWREVRRFMRQRRFDVVHCHRYKELLLAALCVPAGKARIIVTVHGLQPRTQLPLRDVVTTWGSLLLARLRGARFVAVSEELAERLEAFPLLARVARIPNPIPAIGAGESLPNLRARFNWSADRPIVGFLGRLEHVKGPDLFLEVARCGPREAGYVVVGWGSMGGELEALCASEGLAERLKFLGTLAEAAPLLRQIDVLAMTSRHEGTPMVLLEAAECGVPVVAFEAGGIPSLLEHAPREWRVAAGDVQAFSKALRTILEDLPGARAAARIWSESIRSSYAREAVRDRYLQLYLNDRSSFPGQEGGGSASLGGRTTR